jgi:hypothetical protein
VCSLDATVTNANDMQATVSLTGYSWSDIVDAWGFDLWVGNGTVLGASGVNGESKTHPRWSTTTKVPSGGLKRTVTVPRAWGEDTTLAVWCRYSDSNPVKYHGRLDASVTIPRMTSPVHAVSAVADKAAVLPGEPVSLTITDSNGASKALMDHFEIWCGGKLAAKGATDHTINRSETLSIVPSDYAPGGGDLDIIVKSVHEWYGTYPEACATVTVRVCPPVTVYDGTGAARVGAVTAYDSAGAGRRCVPSAYGPDGKVRACTG